MWRSKLKRTSAAIVKNLLGWRTNRKIVVFSVDDFGNVRIASKQSRQQLANDGLDVNFCRFDLVDALENSTDLEMLFDSLCSVKDSNGSSAVFTAYANVANIDFEAVVANNYDCYRSELLPITLGKLEGYESTWKLWQQGIDKKIFVPQFHGREHLNIKYFNDLLRKRDRYLISCIQNRSFTGLPWNFDGNVNYNETFAFDKPEELGAFKNQIRDGLEDFAKVFGYSATCFNSPGATEHHSLHKVLKENGIRFIDSAFKRREHQGNGFYKSNWISWGMSSLPLQTYLLRNCVFEPNLDDCNDMVDECLEQIEIAFYLKKPANISSHRINFCGAVDPHNGVRGNKALRKLLSAIVLRWPDVEFMSASQMGELMTKNA